MYALEQKIGERSSTFTSEVGPIKRDTKVNIKIVEERNSTFNSKNRTTKSDLNLTEERNYKRERVDC